MLSNMTEAQSMIFDILEKALSIPRTKINTTDQLVNDLKIDSDDLSFIFVPEIEKKLGKKIPVSEWDKVFTVQNAIDLVNKYSS